MKIKSLFIISVIILNVSCRTYHDYDCYSSLNTEDVMKELNNLIEDYNNKSSENEIIKISEVKFNLNKDIILINYEIGNKLFSTKSSLDKFDNIFKVYFTIGDKGLEIKIKNKL